jgi:ribosomal protection tetracycline resistance protein
MRILNLGIVAHVDAGKTTLTERLLYAAGVIDEIGSVDDGSTQTDSLPLERQRGITIKSPVVSFVIGEVTVNLIDTPGHPDFIAEVERVLSVLDGAVLVISAVEGVQVQTRVLMRTLQGLHIPTLLFINKIDRPGAQDESVLQSVSEKLTPSIIPMGSTGELGTRTARFEPYSAADTDFTARLVDLLADHDDGLLAAYLEDETRISYRQLRGELAAQTGQALVHPVIFGSAITGAGVESLMAGIEEFLPAADGDVDGPVSGTVFKVERGPAGEKIAYVRLFSGTVRTRDRLLFRRDNEGKVTAIRVFDHGSAVRSASVAAGQIGKLWGLGDIQIGDTIGRARTTAGSHEPDPKPETSLTPRSGGFAGGDCRYFAPPTLETVVVPCRPADKGALHIALSQLAEQDPLINLRQDDRRGGMYVSLYGEVQKEVIGTTLAQEYTIDVQFRETSVICIERPIGTGEAVERLGKGGNPFLATVGLRIEPAPINTGVELRLEVEVGSIPLYVYEAVEEFQRAMEDTVRNTLQQGLSGWQVTDCTVTVTECGYTSPGSTARDFRLLTPLVLMSALKEAGTRVYEPIHRFHMEIPADTYGATVPVLARLGTVLQASATRDSSSTLEGEIPAARVYDLQQQLPAVTRGEGVLDCDFDCYQPVSGAIPSRPRSDHNPLNRKEYLLHVVRRV